MCWVNARTGMPHEHEMPAPDTTTIFLHFATERERLERIRLACASEEAVSRSRVTVIVHGRTVRKGA